MQKLVKVLVFDKEKVLMLKRAKWDEDAGFWEAPGGSVEAGESFKEAAKREVLEESGLVIHDLRELKEIKNATYHVILFSAISEGTVKVSHEHDNFKWFSLKELEVLKETKYPQLMVELFKKAQEGTNQTL